MAVVPRTMVLTAGLMAMAVNTGGGVSSFPAQPTSPVSIMKRADTMDRYRMVIAVSSFLDCALFVIVFIFPPLVLFLVNPLPIPGALRRRAGTNNY